MKVGVISDSHDNLKGLKWAFGEINRMGIDKIVHLGDIISPFVPLRIREMYDGDLWAITGNNDGDHVRLTQNFKKVGFHLFTEEQAFIVLGDRNIVLMHEPRLLDEFAASGDFDFVLYGHTHEMKLRKVRDALILNPGEIYGYITGTVSFAVVDLESLEVEFFKTEVSEVERIPL